MTTLSPELLFTDIAVRGMTAPNRIVMAPMTRGRSPLGVPGRDVTEYYRRRSTGGCGLIVTEGIAVDHPAAIGDAGLDEQDVPLLTGDAVAGWRVVTDGVHADGAGILAQLWHQGVLRKPDTGSHPEVHSVSPSGLWGPLGQLTSIDKEAIPQTSQVGEPMSDTEIDEAVEAFVRSARGAMAAGFDGIALHGGHGYLIDNFLWEATNQRQDRWGGERIRRAEFANELVRRIRAAIGESAPIFFRFSQWKQQDFRASLAENPEQLAELLCPLAEAGVDVFDASVRFFNTPAFEGSPLTLAGWAKKLTGRLSMAVGGVGIGHGRYDSGGTARADNIDLLLQRLEAEEFDLVAVGRAMLGDAEWANKVRRGETPRPFEDADLLQLT